MGDWPSILPAAVSGGVVGISLGLTGGGGSILALPLLVYALGLPLRTAVALSLAVVGATAGLGAALRLGKSEIDWPAGAAFAAGGMALAPLGMGLGRFVPPHVLLSIFGAIMAFVGWRMWRGGAGGSDAVGPCTRRADGRRGRGCHIRLAVAGMGAGLLSGLFGIGGGFVIVPALIYVTGTTIHRAVATSLLVIFLISISGVVTSLWQGNELPLTESVIFLTGAFLGMLAGTRLRSRLAGPLLGRVFAFALWAIAILLIVKNAL